MKEINKGTNEYILLKNQSTSVVTVFIQITKKNKIQHHVYTVKKFSCNRADNWKILNILFL